MLHSKHRTTGYALLPRKEWAGFFRHMQDKTDPARAAHVCFWLIAYTAVRRSEAAGALRSEFDFQAMQWHIPAHRMKAGKPQVVFLAPQVAEMLLLFFARSESVYAFPSARAGGKAHIAPWSAQYMIRSSEYVRRQTLHGLRKVFSSHAHESGLFGIDAIELSLAHVVPGVRGVYNRAQYMNERRRLMHWYAFELDRWRGVKEPLHNLVRVCSVLCMSVQGGL